MTKQEFVKSELARFNKNSSLPFRVACSSNNNGGDYPYGSHTERREYGDRTVGYAYSSEEAEELLKAAWEYVSEVNAEIAEEKWQEECRLEEQRQAEFEAGIAD